MCTQRTSRGNLRAASGNHGHGSPLADTTPLRCAARGVVFRESVQGQTVGCGHRAELLRASTPRRSTGGRSPMRASSRRRSKPPDQVEPLHHLHGRNLVCRPQGRRCGGRCSSHRVGSALGGCVTAHSSTRRAPRRVRVYGHKMTPCRARRVGARTAIARAARKVHTGNSGQSAPRQLR